MVLSKDPTTKLSQIYQVSFEPSVVRFEQRHFMHQLPEFSLLRLGQVVQLRLEPLDLFAAGLVQNLQIVRCCLGAFEENKQDEITINVYAYKYFSIVFNFIYLILMYS